MEVWAKIKGYPNYEISSLGRIKGNRGLLRPYSDSRGYLYVGLHRNGEKKVYSVHRLVALHFIDNPLDKEQVNHIDGDKTNNTIENLEWVTNQENMTHSIEKLGRVRTDKCGRPKKTVQQFSKQGEFIKEYESAHEAARQIDGNFSRIALICRKGEGTHRGYHWKYKEENQYGSTN